MNVINLGPLGCVDVIFKLAKAIVASVENQLRAALLSPLKTREGTGELLNFSCKGHVVTFTVRGQCATSETDLIAAADNAGFAVISSSCSTTRTYNPATDK